MRRARLFTVVGAGIAGLLAVVPADARSGDTSESQVSGTVKKVDTARKAIELSGSDGTLNVSNQTQIMKDGQRATLSDVQEGDEVRASYPESGGTSQVKRLDVVGGPSFTDQG